MQNQEAKQVELKIANNDKTLPDPPPGIIACIERPTKAGKDANERVINTISSNESRRICGKRLIEWYKCVQAANSSDKAAIEKCGQTETAKKKKADPKVSEADTGTKKF